jgi:hypothetical protein
VLPTVKQERHILHAKDGKKLKIARAAMGICETSQQLQMFHYFVGK